MHLARLFPEVLPQAHVVAETQPSATASTTGGNRVSHEPANYVKSKQIVSQYKGLFNKPPERVPSFHVVDGPITGNGDIGLTVSGPPERQRYWISKSDFWKSGPDFHQCGPSLIGGIDVRIDTLKDASYHIEQILYEPVITSDFSTKDNTVSMDARVLATDNLIVLEIKVDNDAVEVQLDLWAKDGYGSETEDGRKGEVLWVTRKFNAGNLMYPSEATIAMRKLEYDKTSFVLKPGKPVTIVVSVTTNHESKEYHARARKKAGGLKLVDIKRLELEHNKWWRAFWARSFVELESKLIEKHYYASHYLMACCSRNENFPPGLYGNWITVDRTAWAGDIHLNYNHEAPFWGLYSSNRVALTDPYDAPLCEQLEGFKKDARKYLNQRGAYASVGIGPKGLVSRFFDMEGMHRAYKEKNGGDSCSYEHLAGQPMFLGQKSNAIFASMNMILRYHYTYDQDYARRIYPYLSAVATFWEDYLTFEDGRYVIRNDSFGEVGPWQRKNWREGYGDFNPIKSLGFLRTFFNAIIGISQDLKLDEDRQDKWRHILTNLSDFPVHSENGRKRFRACEGGNGAASDIIGMRWSMIHGLVYPATNIGLSSDPEHLKMIRDDMKQWGDGIWLHHGNAFQTVFIGAARVGYDPDFLLAKATEKITKYSYSNLWINAMNGGIETCSGIPGMVNEMMLQSHRDIIRIFPVFPSNQKASFYRLRTFGAFLVSSAIENGKVQHVIVESEKGRECIILNPWPHKTVSVLRNGKESETTSGTTLRFTTEPGEQLILVPEGTSAKEITAPGHNM